MPRRCTIWYAAQGAKKTGETSAEKQPFLFYDGQDVVFTHHKIVVAINFDFGSGVFAEQDDIADLDIQRQHLAVFGFLAVAGGNDFAALRFFLGGLRNEKTSGCFGLFFYSLYDDAVLQWS